MRLLATAPGRDALGLWRQGGDGLGVATRSGLTYLRLVGQTPSILMDCGRSERSK